MPKRPALADIAFKIGLVAVEWVAAYEITALFFSQFAYSDRASWIFPPAALRVISVLLFGWAGAAGLVLGAYFTLPHDRLGDLPYELMMALTSGAAPWIALAACRRYLSLPVTLSGLRTQHVVAASVSTAIVNSLLVNACMTLFDRWHGDVGQVATIIVGDIAGTAIVLGLIALLARLITRRAG